MRPSTPSTSSLLTGSAAAAATRLDELLGVSRPRTADRLFNLPQLGSETAYGWSPAKSSAKLSASGQSGTGGRP